MTTRGSEPRRVLLTGASGLLGTWMRRSVPAGVAVTAVVHRAVVEGLPTVVADLADAASAERLLAGRPDVVVHLAYSVDRTGIVDATATVATAAAASGAALVLLSTEAVFAGDGRPRAETDVPDPVADYGRWKVAAEQVARAAVADVAVVRAPLLVSLDPADTTTARLAAAGLGEEQRWYRGERRQAAWAEDVAEAVWRLVGLPRAGAAGVWHLPGAAPLSRFVLGRRLAALVGRADLVHTEVDPPAAPRPADLVLRGDRAVRELDWRPRTVVPHA